MFFRMKEVYFNSIEKSYFFIYILNMKELIIIFLSLSLNYLLMIDFDSLLLYKLTLNYCLWEIIYLQILKYCTIKIVYFFTSI